jgi:hypothetical protein
MEGSEEEKVQKINKLYFVNEKKKIELNNIRTISHLSFFVVRILKIYIVAIFKDRMCFYSLSLHCTICFLNMFFLFN